MEKKLREIQISTSIKQNEIKQQIKWNKDEIILTSHT